MKILKRILLVLAILIGTVLITGLIMPKEVNLERMVTINDSLKHVWPQVSNLHSMSVWSPWKDYDPEMEVSYEGTDGTVGAQYHWSGNKSVGTGYQEIAAIDPGKRIDLDLVFQEPWESESNVYFLFEDLGDQTRVTWGYTEPTPVPKNVMMRLMGVEKMLSKEFDKGLSRLKKVCEEKEV